MKLAVETVNCGMPRHVYPKIIRCLVVIPRKECIWRYVTNIEFSFFSAFVNLYICYE